MLRFNEGGPEALIDCKAPGKTPVLSDDQRAALAAATEAGPDPDIDGAVRWRLAEAGIEPSVGSDGAGALLEMADKRSERPNGTVAILAKGSLMGRSPIRSRVEQIARNDMPRP